MNDDSLAPLSEAQQEIMEIVWKRGEVSVNEVRDSLAKHRAIARNTVQTLMTRMLEKGWLKYRTIGRAFLYSAVVPKKTSMGQKVKELVDSAFGGSAEELMSALLDYRGLTKEEADRIRALIDASEKDRDVSKRKGKS